MSSRTTAALVAALTILLPTTSEANDECGASYTEAQVLRRDGKLRAAHRALLRCSLEMCSSAVRVDCIKWADEVERALPSVVFVTRLADGTDITDAEVFAGDERIATVMDGRHVTFDPGEVTLRFVRGEQAVEKRIVIREGEKLRTVVVTFPLPEPVDPPLASAPPEQRVPDAVVLRPSPAPERRPSRVPMATWVAGGVGLAGLIGFGVLSAVGYANESQLRSGCAKTSSCGSADVDDVRTQYLVGDVALGVGIVAIAVAVVTAWSRVR